MEESNGYKRLLRQVEQRVSVVELQSQIRRFVDDVAYHALLSHCCMQYSHLRSQSDLASEKTRGNFAATCFRSQIVDTTGLSPERTSTRSSTCGNRTEVRSSARLLILIVSDQNALFS